MFKKNKNKNLRNTKILAGKDRGSSSSQSVSATPTPLNNSVILTSTTTTLSISASNSGSMSGVKKDGTRDLVTEARSFTSSLANVFLMKKRDPQSKHLLEKAQFLIDALVAENQRLATPRWEVLATEMGKGGGGVG